jgi:hypothetical protein
MTGMPRKGSPRTFVGLAVNPPPGNVRGLRFSVEARHGGTALIDLTDVRPRPIALAFASALMRLAGSQGPLGTVSTIKQHAQGYRHFLAFLCDSASSVKRLEQLRAGHIDTYEAEIEAQGKSPIHRHLLISKPINALREIEADRPGTLHSGLVDRLAYVSASPFGRSIPRDAYSPFVARQLRDAARGDIDAIFRRFGRPIFPAHDPRHDRFVARAAAVIEEHGRLSWSHPLWPALYMARARRGLPTRDLTEDLHRPYHLMSTDIPPLFTLLSIETGLETECLKALTIDCLHDARDGAVSVAYVKRRARGAEHKSIRVRDGGLGTPGGLIRRLIEATAFTRRFVASDCLWVYFIEGKLRSGIGHPRQTLDDWTSRHGIVDDDGSPFRLVLSRLRKTHKALWYRKTEGHMARFALGHTMEVAARHYADIPSLRPIHERTVAAAFSDAVASAMPTVLSPSEEERWRTTPDEPPDDLRADADVKGLLSGNQDVWLAACTGFDRSPFGVEGEPCPQPFWGCLECRNAVITARKLPAILAFLTFMEEQRHSLAAQDWSLKFGRAHARITSQILPRFADGVIAAAKVEACSAALYLPPEARA